MVDGLTPAEAEDALKYYAPTAEMGEFHLGPFGRVVSGPKSGRVTTSKVAEPIKESPTTTEHEGSPAAVIEAARKRMEDALKPTSVDVQTTTRSGAREVRPLTNEEKDIALAQVARGERPKAASGTGEFERIVVTPRGDVMSEAQAVARRGPYKTSHTFEEALGLKTKEGEYRKGVWFKIYEDTKGNEIGRSFYIKRGIGPEGEPEYFPADADTGDVLIAEWSHAPQWSQAVMMRIMHDIKPKYLYAPEAGVSRMARHKLGATRIEGSDVVRFENIGKKK
jgi:hypothetical protein